MPGAAFGLPLHSICFQEIKYFVFLKAISLIFCVVGVHTIISVIVTGKFICLIALKSPSF